MRSVKQCAIVFVAVSMLGVGMAPALADTVVTRRPVTGSVTGKAPYTYGGKCSFVDQHFIAAIATRSGVASIDVDVCVTLQLPDFPLTGTYTITNGTFVQTGTATGLVYGTASPSPFQLTLQRVGRSSLMFSGTLVNTGTNNGPIDGSITDRVS